VFWHLNLMHNEEVVSLRLNLFYLKLLQPHKGLELNFLFWVHNTALDFFIFTPSLKIETKERLIRRWRHSVRLSVT
jgi:hypothetical protein